MSYADLITHSPKSLRTSQDRFSLSSSSSSSLQIVQNSPKGSLTPDKRLFKTNSSLNSLHKRNLSSTILFSSNRQQSHDSSSSSPHRHWQNNLTLTNSPNANKRIYPTKPIVKLPIEHEIPTDFYISPIDWSKKDIIITILTDSLIHTYQPKLDIVSVRPYEFESDPISIKINNFSDGSKAAIGFDNGSIQIFDIATEKVEQYFEPFNSTVMVSNWSNQNLIISGNKEGDVSLLDPTSNGIDVFDNFFNEEICGIQINPIQPNICAISSNDSLVKLFDLRNMSECLLKYTEHKSAVKALAFSPNNENIIVSGGGTLDKSIRMWDTITGQTKYVIDTNSQVCNLFWNKEFNEIVSTHGFSQNQIALWRGSNLGLINEYCENYNRVLYMTHSFDNAKIATLIPSEGINIWKFFPSQKPSLANTILEFK